MKEKVLKLLQESDGFVSGQELSERFGVTRTSIWKAIRQLEEDGYQIEAVRNRGYRLCGEPDFLDEAHLRPLLHTSWAGREIVSFDTIDSSNNEAKRRAEDGAGHGLVVLAQEQTAGRGRRGRVWASVKGEGIFLSLLLKPDIRPENASMLTLVMGMAVRDALEKVAGIDARIKWPNDIVCEGKKVCGILTEMSAQVDYINHIVIGVGVNIHNGQFPEEMQQIATSVFLLTGKHVARAAVAAEILAGFELYYDRYMKTQDLRDLSEIYNRHLINCGRHVRVTDLKEDYTGIARGINERGELIIETENGLRLAAAGEVSVRGVYGYV